MDCLALNEDVVWIRPIIARTKSGIEITEIGIGGGWQDLNRGRELELKSEDVTESLLRL
jgi:hypothetical protein